MTTLTVKKPQIHLLLVSQQPIPNITPLLDERYRPDEVILLVSPDMQQRCHYLEALFSQRGIRSTRWPIQDPYDIEALRDQIMDLLAVYEHRHIALNATGGTKPMSIAAYEVFRADNKPIFYVHPERDKLIWMYPKQAAVDLADRLKIPEYLLAYGARVVKTGTTLGVPALQRQLTAYIIENLPIYAYPLSQLNYFAAQATNNRQLLSPDLGDSVQSGAFMDLLDVFINAGFVTLSRNRLRFTDEASHFYVNGGWLENHVYGVCLNLKKNCGIQDIARSVEVERNVNQQTVNNEIDVALLKDNRLFLIECKTQRYQGSHNRMPDQGTGTLYKLDSLTDLLGGIQAKAMLVSYNGLPEHNVVRAGELKISLCCHQELLCLTDKIQNWVMGHG